MQWFLVGNLGFLGFYNFKSLFLPLKITFFFRAYYDGMNSMKQLGT